MVSKIEKIKNDFENFGSLIVAFSGGVDSSVLAYLAKKAVDEKALAITVDSEIFPKREIEESKKIAKEIGINHRVIDFSLLNEPRFIENNSKRCYYCKKEIFSSLRKFSSQEEYNKVVEGTNTSEIKGHRPGYEAIKELNIYSPFVEYGVKKEEVRELAAKLGLAVYDKPSNACLASRISYEEKITSKKLDMVEKAEDLLYDMDFRQFRVRKHGDLARIELPRDKRDLDKDQMNYLESNMKKIGFKYITLDLTGYRSGSMN
ncbi:ATP-dependent sacrificial sulfur transferase LarE [archaeon SCG-AAA382B04]|nr:ATP-dependent sacrificial sulfur transferase LarE [archaeon SCG-AAA382B04]